MEKLKVLNYERDYCKKYQKKAFNRVHFVIPGVNASHQFDDFITICTWLFFEISRKADVFKPEEFDDPNTIVNKLLLALRNVEFKSSFPAQKLKSAHGEPVCTVLEFLADKALEVRSFQWSSPTYPGNTEVLHDLLQIFNVFFAHFVSHVLILQIEQAEEDNDVDGDIQEDDLADGIEDDLMFEEPNKLDASLDGSTHHILQAAVDPIEWKTELERVGPKLRASLQLSTNEWRSHVDQTVTSKEHIEKVLGETQGDLQTMNK